MSADASSADLLLAEELLLLVLDDGKGHDKTLGGADSGLAGALLIELAARGWLELAAGRLVPTVPPPAVAPAASVLAVALAIIAAEGTPRDAGHWVRKLPGELKPIKGSVAARLVDLGILSPQRRKVLGLVPVDRYPELDPEPERLLRRRLRAELTGTTDLSSRTAMLIPLLRAYNLVDKLVDRPQRKEASRLTKAVAEDPGKVTDAVGSALNDTQIAVSAAITAAVAASVASGGGDGSC